MERRINLASPKDKEKDRELVKKIAMMVMQGAVMLAETCPICGSPLLRLKTGETVCPIHGRVIMVRSDEEAKEIELDSIVAEVEHYAAQRIRELMASGQPNEILEWLRVIEAGERIRELRERRRIPTREADRDGEKRGKKG
ncbi:MAG: hypothetical protein F7B78_05450 [Desulfurococcales archaeon]|nr:hypothetical protein [Desulfurococcales archaeon]